MLASLLAPGPATPSSPEDAKIVTPCRYRRYIDLCCSEDKRRWVIVSMVVICDASGITGYDRRMPELSNAALPMK